MCRQSYKIAGQGKWIVAICGESYILIKKLTREFYIMAKKLFGTDGVRGVANVYPMTAEFAVKLGMACGQEICRGRKRAAIGRDTRISGEMLEAALTAGLTAAGVDVVKLGVLPTPALTSVTPELGVDMSFMITASHNPYQDNGIKLIAADGDKFSDDITSRLEEIIAEDNFVLSSDVLGTVSENKEAVVLYLEKAKSFIESERPLKGLRVVLDCANGVFSEIMPQVFMDLGAGVIALGNKPDGRNINKDCGSQHPEQMFETVRGAHAQLGIAVDGDGDRIVVCNEKGEKIAGEQLIAFLAQTLKAEGKYHGNAVVSTVLSNTALERYVRSLGMDYYSTKVGERAVIAKMRELGCSVGGEESGHIVAADYGKTGDGMVTALLVSLGLLKSGKKMSEIFPLFDFDPFVFVNLRVKDRDTVKAAVADEKVKNAVQAATDKMAGNGRVVLHPSGTEPVVRVWVSGSNEALVRELSSSIVDEIKRFQ